MSSVDLGYLEECNSWEVESRLFPSKVGGKPAWLDLKNLPSATDLSCSICSKQMIFLCQLYAPFEEVERNFHRSLFVFICRNKECCGKNNSKNLKVFRNSLKQVNDFYPSTSPKEEPDPSFDLQKWNKLCEICGCKAEKHCSKCKNTNYCCREHQIIDWKAFHKSNCGNNITENKSPKLSSILFSEWAIVQEPEDLDEKDVSDNKEIANDMLKEINQIGSLASVSEQELIDHTDENYDKEFFKFRKRITHNPDQVIRYERNGVPLYISKNAIPTPVPDCESCGSPRQFEFQIMPQMLSFLKEIDLDWGILLIYTCKVSCNYEGYKEEVILKQDICSENA